MSSSSSSDAASPPTRTVPFRSALVAGLIVCIGMVVLGPSEFAPLKTNTLIVLPDKASNTTANATAQQTTTDNDNNDNNTTNNTNNNNNNTNDTNTNNNTNDTNTTNNNNTNTEVPEYYTIAEELPRRGGDPAVYAASYPQHVRKTANNWKNRNRVAISMLQSPSKLWLPLDLNETAVDPWRRGGHNHFRTTFFPDAACDAVLFNQSWFRAVGDVLVRQWMAVHPQGFNWTTDDRRNKQEKHDDVAQWKPNPPTQEELVQAQHLWLQGLNDCHGMLPLTPGLHYDAFHGYNYFEYFAEASNVVGNTQLNQFRETSLYEKFEVSATCLLHLQYPFTPLPVYPAKGHWWRYPLRVAAPQWQPRRLVVLTVATYARGKDPDATESQSVEKLLRKLRPFLQSHYERGYEVWVATGETPHFLLMDKFKYSLKLVEAALAAQPEIPPEDTLFVFGDAVDVLAQYGPQYLTERFLDQNKPFVWSAGDCTPLNQQVHSTSNIRQDWICQNGGFFPHQPVGSGFHPRDALNVNSGSWIGIGPFVRQYLTDIMTFLDHDDPREWRQFHDGRPMNRHCSYGYDQLFGHVSYIRHRDYVGLDSFAIMFAALGDGKLREHAFMCGPDAYDDVDGEVGYGWDFENSDAGVATMDDRRRSRVCYGKSFDSNEHFKQHQCNRTTMDVYQCPAVLHLFGDGKLILDDLFDVLLTESEKAGTRKSCRPGDLKFLDVNNENVMDIAGLEQKYDVKFSCFEPNFCSKAQQQAQ